MTQEALDFIFSTRQLTDYREDWPGNCNKGCLFIVTDRHHTHTFILDTPWRVGTSWQDNFPVLPLERESMAYRPGRDIFRKHMNFGQDILLVGYPSFLLSYLFSPYATKSENEFQQIAKEIWDYYVQREGLTGKNINKEINTFWGIKTDDRVVLNKVSRIIESIISIDLLFDINFKEWLFKTWESMIKSQLGVWFNSISTQERLIFENIRLSVPRNKNLWFVFNPTSFCIQSLHYEPVGYERVKRHGRWIKEPYYDGEDTGTIEGNFAQGIVACVLNFCACNKMMENYMDGHTIRNEFMVEDLIEMPIDIVNLSCNIMEIFESYWSIFYQRYTNNHLSDPDFFNMSEDERKRAALEECLEAEKDYKEKNSELLPYLTPDKLNQLHAYHEGFLTFLRKKLKELGVVSASVSAPREDSIRQEAPSDKKTFLWPLYTTKATEDDKQTFEDYMRRLCKEQRRSMTTDIKKYLALKVEQGIITRPEQQNDEYTYICLFGYPRAQKTYYNS